MLLIVTYSDEVSGDGEGRPGDVEPVGAGQELVGILTCLEEVDEALELRGVLGADIDCAALKVLGVLDTTNEGIYAAVTKSGVDDDWTADGFAGGLQQVAAAVGHVGYLLDGGDVLWVFLPVAELGQLKVR